MGVVVELRVDGRGCRVRGWLGSRKCAGKISELQSREEKVVERLKVLYVCWWGGSLN